MQHQASPANAKFSGGTTTVKAGSGDPGTMTVTGRHRILQRYGDYRCADQSGGLLNGTGTLTVSGLSTLSGGRRAGRDDDCVGRGGVQHDGFSLDGGRTLQLGGTSTATGTYVQIDLNGGNRSVAPAF